MKENNGPPSRVVIYRDGVGDGQIQYVLDTEVAVIKETLKNLCGGNMPRFTFIVVTKRINSKFFRVSQVESVSIVVKVRVFNKKCVSEQR